MKAQQSESYRLEAEADGVKDRLIAELADRIGTLGVEMADIAGNLDQVTHRFDQQAEQFKSLQQTAATMVSANRAIDVAARNAQSAATDAGSGIAQSSETVSGAVRHIGDLIAAVERIEGRLASVRTVLEQVTGLSGTIDAIARQTNLLALNATIEAARAGDAGRGFAVVASEVKALAAQTSKATEEIGTQIAGMQSATEASVTAIKEISTTITLISEISSTIAAAVEEQGAATQEIARNVQHAAQRSTAVAENINDVSRGAGETGSASSQVLSSAQTLSNESTRLKMEVENFLTNVRAA
ncbi:MAG: hypothetical protein A4S14_12925 [Proteobacteria bacterium SG_bin9]|nr:MAG: hypothetical protein A4S14_12925 [Proteobacteria bacterium SG_bin9]